MSVAFGSGFGALRVARRRASSKSPPNFGRCGARLDAVRSPPPALPAMGARCHGVDLRRRASLNAGFAGSALTSTPINQGSAATSRIVTSSVVWHWHSPRSSLTEGSMSNASAAPDPKLEGLGRIALTGRRLASTRPQDISIPRLGKYPAGNLVGTLAATGVLAPAWRASIVGRDHPAADAGVALSERARQRRTRFDS
jgi:hypothetical protein